MLGAKAPLRVVTIISGDFIEWGKSANRCVEVEYFCYSILNYKSNCHSVPAIKDSAEVCGDYDVSEHCKLFFFFNTKSLFV